MTPVAAPASVRDLLRAARERINVPLGDESAAPLELRYSSAAPPRLADAPALETGFAVREVPGAPEPAFAAFLDGVQESRVIAYTHGVPVVVGVTGAVILERGPDKRLVAWGDGARVTRTLVLPRVHVDDLTWQALSNETAVEDSGARADALHPDTLLGDAVSRVEGLRAASERALALAWSERESRPLAADGSITGLGAAASSAHVIGIVKSHRTLYAPAAALTSLYALPVGARTPAFLLTPSDGRAQAQSWYLRLRPASAANPLHGLVRIEIAPARDVSARADEASRWVLAERTPIALPDARWDVMSYGIARCEAYLKRGLALRART
ncbi:MAG TPA: hypothetical protein VE967_13890 [Gemmatimonadaceae bacterium]|nr:hypothetical protein [Gemmatimonadaceae bacterium]